MSDEKYRQERRPLKSEIQSSSPESQEPLTGPEEFQKAVQNMTEGQNTPSPQPVPDGFTVQGNAPPEFLQKMSQKGIKVENPPSQPPPELRVTGSSKLEDLVEGAKPYTNVYEEVKLPSLGKFYDGEDGPTDGIIHLRLMTGEEEQILATPRFVKKGTAVNMIFNRCIQENYASENLLSADRTYLLIYLRGISYSKEYDVEVTCPFTDRRFSETVDLDLHVTTCPVNYGSQNLSGVLPRTKYKFHYRLARGFDEQKIQEYRDRKSKFDSTTFADDTLLYRTTLLIEEIEGLTEKNELLVLLKKLPIEDVAHLRNVTNEPPFGVDTKITIISKFTMEEFEIDLPLEANFFFPRPRREPTQV